MPKREECCTDVKGSLRVATILFLVPQIDDNHEKLFYKKSRVERERKGVKIQRTKDGEREKISIKYVKGILRKESESI